MDRTLHLSLPYIMPAQAQKHVTHNEALRVLDAVVQMAVASRAQTAPPGSPPEGVRHIVADGGTGAWSGWDGAIALYTDGAWMQLVPQIGWTAWVEDEGLLVAFNGGGWQAIEGVDSDPEFERVGILTAADPTNRLAVKSDAVLFSHDDQTPGTGDLRVTLNKASSSKDAGLILQDGWSSRALLGLLGNDDFTVKVSPDGASYHEALVVERAAGTFKPRLVQDDALPSPTGRENFALLVWDGANPNTTRLAVSNGNVWRRVAMENPMSASAGGQISENDGYYYHRFTTSGTFTPGADGSVEVYVVGGGGGGSNYGGGGGGGVANDAAYAVSAGVGVTVTVGGGGTGGTTGSNGGSSAFGTLTADGGGRGGIGASGNGAAGGSGGGGSYGSSTGGAASAGHAGGNGLPGGSPFSAGGGGGAGAAGGNGTNAIGGAGGAGIEIWGAYYAGGGGGGHNAGAGGNAAGGQGGGGQGGKNNVGQQSGAANTGGGGGGAGTTGSPGAAGGSGVVMVRYKV